MEHQRLERSGVLIVLLWVSASRILWSQEEATAIDIAAERMEVMKVRALAVQFSSNADGFPRQVQDEPLFRYDDPTRGYVDGTVWRLGATGRPLAIITAELNPDYLGSGPRIVYDLLSVTDRPFVGQSPDFKWRSSQSAVEMKPLPDGPDAADSDVRRLLQLKQTVRRFSAYQRVEEVVDEDIQLRLVPTPIDRYVPCQDGKPKSPNADGAVFVFAAGRMPGVILFLETDGASGVMVSAGCRLRAC